MNKLITKVLKTNLQAQFNGKDVLIPAIIGSRGTGKTSGIKQITKDLGAEILNVSIPSKTLDYFNGIPEFVMAEYMKKYSVSNAPEVKGTNWSAPELIVQANNIANTHGKCVILLDDFHKLTGGIQEAMYEFLLERKLGDYKLDDNVAIVCAMNFSEESGAGTMEEPIKDRLSLLKVDFDFDYWYKNFGRFLHHYVASFLKNNQSLILEDESVTLESSGSPRSWTQLSNDFELYDRQFIGENAVFLAKQKVTPETALELAKHIAYMEKIDFDLVIKNRELKDISSLPTLDRITWAYIINYIETPEDAAYIIDLINYNSDEQNFVGHISAQIHTKYQVLEQGKPLNTAVKILIAKLMDDYKPEDFDLTDKEQKVLENTNFKDSSTIMQTAYEYIH